LLLAGAARAEEIEVHRAVLRTTEDSVLLSADFEFELSPRLAEWVANGVPLHFVVDFDLVRKRWWWFDEKTLSKRLQLRLSYHAVSRNYRLSTGTLQQNYATLNEALNVIRRLRSWSVAERTALQPEASYQASLRMRLDTSQLPRPFQLTALTSRDIVLESPWLRFDYRVPAATAAPAPGVPAEGEEPHK
jgi:hypothetical protein